MKETVLDVLMYIFDNYIEDDLEFTPDQESLKSQLIEAGFRDLQIDKAFLWLEGLATQRDFADTATSDLSSIRVFNDQELDRLNAECRGFLLFLEQARVLNPPPPQRRRHYLDGRYCDGRYQYQSSLVITLNFFFIQLFLF
jgi:Smg protein